MFWVKWEIRRFGEKSAVERTVVNFMCSESPRALAPLLKTRSQSEVLIFSHILEVSPALERLMK